MTTLHRFFVRPEEAAGERFAVPASIERQVRRVLRLTDGERLVVLTGDGTESVCRLEGGACVVESRSPVRGEPTHRLSVVQALLKGDALEDVVQQGTEVGVAAFQLVVAGRCVVRELSERKLERLRAVARESAEQSERGAVPAVGEPVPLARIVGRGAVVLAERADAVRLTALEPPHTVVIGPEGGFTPAELDGAVAAGARLAGLGPRILRSRTVTVAVAAAILSRTGDFA